MKQHFIPLTEVFFAQKQIIKENVSADTIVDIPFKLFNTGLNDLRINVVVALNTLTELYKLNAVLNVNE